MATWIDQEHDDAFASMVDDLHSSVSWIYAGAAVLWLALVILLTGGS